MVEGQKTISLNRQARHEYFIEDSLETGIVLSGTEVKSIRLGRLNLKDSFARIENGEAFIMNMHISPYEQGNRFNLDPIRPRKLLMHKSEIRKLNSTVKERGYTLVPLRMYFKRGLIKLEIGLGKGKKLYDKREDDAKKDALREIDRAIKERFRD